MHVLWLPMRWDCRAKKTNQAIELPVGDAWSHHVEDRVGSEEDPLPANDQHPLVPALLC